MQRVNPNISSLIVSLIPPAIFIAVMAMQLRYFKPSFHTQGRAGQMETSFSALDLSTLVPFAMRNVVRKLQGGGEEEVMDDGAGEVEVIPGGAGGRYFSQRNAHTHTQIDHSN